MDDGISVASLDYGSAPSTVSGPANTRLEPKSPEGACAWIQTRSPCTSPMNHQLECARSQGRGRRRHESVTLLEPEWKRTRALGCSQ